MLIGQEPAPPSVPFLETFFSAVEEDPCQNNARPFYLLVGPAGIGKSTALHAYLQQHPNAETIVSLEAVPKLTASALFERLLRQLHWPPAHGSLVERGEEVQQALQYSNVELIVLDQADEFSASLFDIILGLAQVCPLILVGREAPLLSKLQHPYVWRHRQGLQRMRPFSEEDILQHVLPSLHVPRFIFDPISEHDLALGRALWKLTGPSLRDLRRVIEQASEAARASHLKTITLACLHAGFPQAVTDAPRTTWSELMWLLAVGLFQQEYEEAHDHIERGVVKVNETTRHQWWWIVQPGDNIWCKFSKRSTHSLTVDEKLLRQANTLRRRIERMKPAGRPPYL